MTLLVKGARILGGGLRPDPVDVFINGDKISAIGTLGEKNADTVLDAQGAHLAPGFIDPNTETDHYLEVFSHPAQDDFLRQGITSILGGQEGSSLAPLMYGTLESLEEWTSPDRANIDWHSLSEFLAHLERHPLGVNFGTFVGHSTIRRALIGERLRELTKNELAVFSRLLEESMQSGGFGLSVNLKSVYGRKTPYTELKTLGAIVAKHRGFISIALRKAVGIPESISETLRLAKDAGAPVVISNFLPIIGQNEEYEQALEQIEGLAGDVDVRFDVSPFEQSIRPLYRFLPDWAQTGSLDDMAKHIADDWMRPRLLKEFPAINPNDFTIAKARHNDTVVGYTLRELMDLYSITKPAEALYKLMVTTRLRALVSYRNVDEHLIARALSHPRSFVASKGVSFAGHGRERMMKTDHSTRTFPHFIETVVEKNLMTLEGAVKKVTAYPADTLGVKDRGVIAEGKVADLTCFSFQHGVFTHQFTIVNGSVAIRQNTLQNVLAGKPLRHRI